MTRPLRWGILGCGSIAKTWAHDLCIDPSTRNVKDVHHVIVAAGTSSSKARAQTFIDSVLTAFVRAGKDEQGRPVNPDQVGVHVKAYGSYESLVEDDEVDIIYIATPHSHHYQHVLLALEAGKHVLCEKSFTVNAKQTRALVDLARSRKLFLMEAMWTRHFPLTKEVQKLVLEDHVLGHVYRVFADLGMPFDPDHLEPSSRMIDPNLAGGALLDLGIYPLTWAWLMGWKANGQKMPDISASMLKNKRTGVDESTVIALNWTEAHQQSIVTCSMTVHSPNECVVRIQGSKGDMLIEWGPFRPTTYIIRRHGQPDEKVTREIPGHGMFWQCDECYQCLVKGDRESQVFPLDESVLVMQLMDVVRQQSGIVYPDAIEKV